MAEAENQETNAELEGVGFEALLESANEASRRCRTVYLTFLLVAVYFALIVGSTTDEQILRGTAIALPILNVDLPIVGVYLVGPFLFGILHFNLLLNLFLLSRKLFDLDRKLAVEGSDHVHYRRLVDIFPFSQYILETHYNKRMQSLLFFVAWITVVATPMALLLWAQVRFLPYHSDGVSGWHAALLVVDIGMLWVFWPMMISDKGTVAGWWRELAGTGQRIFWAGVPAVVSVFLSYITLFVAIVPAGWVEIHFKSPDPVNSLDWLGEKAGIRFRYLDLSERTLVRENAPPEIIAALVARKASAEEIETARLEFTKGLNLQGRDLRGANLRHARLYKADLRETDLREADLEKARLQGAIFFREKGQKEDVKEENWDIRDKKGADLRGAFLLSARLQGADLRYARLEGVDLTKARLQGADLRGARLQGTDLSEANLRGADLRKAFLQGAILAAASLEGADLKGAALQGVDFLRASLQGANLENVNLRFANLVNVRLAQLPAKEWKNLRLRLEGEIPVGRARDRALRLLRAAEEKGFRINKVDAERALYDTEDPLLASLKRPLPPPPDWNFGAYNSALISYLLELGCEGAAVAKGIARRLIIDPIGLEPALIAKACSIVKAAIAERSQKLWSKGFGK